MKIRFYYVFVLVALGLGNCTIAQSSYDTVRDVRIIDNNTYYELIKKERTMYNRVCYTYMGSMDSISVYLDGELFYSGTTSYDARTGVKDLLFFTDRNFKKDSILLTVHYHERKLVSLHYIPNKYNTVLIHKQVPSVTIYLYLEKNKFY